MRAVVLVIVMVLASCIAAAAQPEIERTDPAAAKEVFSTIAKWADAVRNRDTKALDTIFETDLIVTTFDGKTRGKAEELEVLKPGGDMKTVSINNEDVKVRIFDKTALVTALTRMKFILGEKESLAAFRYTAVFIKKDGRWQIVALQTGRLPQQPPSK
ncbi:MAG: nuclear transport factor 2 family protein [Pyrinomonadaceae bacterium]